MKRNKNDQVLFSSFRQKVNKETLDELNGFTILVDESRKPLSFDVDYENKRVILRTEAPEVE